MNKKTYSKCAEKWKRCYILQKQFQMDIIIYEFLKKCHLLLDFF